MTGTLINAGSVMAGSILGFILHSKLPKKLIITIFQGIGLFTLFLGISMALKTTEYLVMIFSLVLGSVLGEWIDIDRYFARFSDYLKGISKNSINSFSNMEKAGDKVVKKDIFRGALKKRLKMGSEKFSEGFITAFLLYCMGSMTILGAIEEGLGNKPNLLLAKSFMDGVSSVALAAGMGIGVMFSAIPLLVYQGSLTLLTEFFGDMFSGVIINELTAVGGILLIGLGLNILEIKKLKILNMLPALVVVVVLAYFFVKV